MAKLEIAECVALAEKRRLWPLLWLHGPERMRIRELEKRIRRIALGADAPAAGNWNESTFEGASVSAEEILFEAQSLSLGGGTRLLWVRDAHHVKDAERLLELGGAHDSVDSLPTVVVCVSPTLDARKSYVKALQKSSVPVVHCPEIELGERPRWIAHLAKLREVALTDEAAAALGSLDPWSLDRVDSELSKLELWKGRESEALAVLSAEAVNGSDSFAWTDAFWARDRRGTLPEVGGIAESPDRALPLLGLLASQLRQMQALHRGERLTAPDFVIGKLRRALPRWNGKELSALERALGEIDFESKQNAKLAIGHWTTLALQFGARR